MNHRWKTYSGIAVTALVLLMVLAFGGVYASWYLPVDALLFLLALAVLWLPGVRLSWLDATVLLLLALPCAQLAFGITVDRAATETWLLHWIAAASVYLIARRTLKLEMMARILAACGGLLALEAIAQQFLAPRYVYGLFRYSYAAPMGPFVNRDDFAACMVLMLPFALFLAVRPARAHRSSRGEVRNWQALWWALSAATAVAAVLISASRGGTLVVGAELIAFATLECRRRAKSSAWLIGGIVLILLIGAYAAGFHAILVRFQNDHLSATERLSFNQSGLRMGAARPVLGWGLGTWVDVYPAFQRTPLDVVVDYAHNDWVQMFAETGAAGIVLVALLGLALLREARRAWSRMPQLAPAAVIALAGLCLHSTVEFVFHIPALLLLFALIAGMLVGAAAPAKRSALKVATAA